MKCPFVLLFVFLTTTFSFAEENKISEQQTQWIEVYKKQKNVPKPTDMLVNTDPEPDLTAEGFVDLYNGKDLSNWTRRGGTCSFEAKGDTIVGTCVKGASSTYLSTNRSDYTDFIFTAELKWEVDGNTGFMIRAQSKPGKKEGSENETVFGPQVEMEGFGKKGRGWSGGIYGQGVGGWEYPLWLEAHAEVRQALKKDDFNRITVHVQGDTVKTWLNGLPAAHWKTEEYQSGFFGLQIHSGSKGTVLFRNLKVKEL